MDTADRVRVRRRAGDKCEYCRLPQSAVPVVNFHIEHIVARQHGGTDSLSNLALACFHCNLHKGPNLAGIDPDSGVMVPLFDPRTQRWELHFEIKSAIIVGRTPVGRATVHVLDMNSDDLVQLRREQDWS